ncbi:MAG: hypothetical protein OSA99_12290 [Acidimicrobiales bacterium]|nr:hypothetical protein [Acidimicrobiales bacterium]
MNDRTRPKYALRRSGLALAAALSLTAIGCGDDDGTAATGAQPDAVSGEFQSDALADIPIPGAAQAINAPSENDGAVAQSYEIPGRTPAQVLDEFTTDLAGAGWTLAVEPEQVGTTGVNGEWTKDGEVLEISATPFNANDGDAVVTQFSLVLRSG